MIEKYKFHCGYIGKEIVYSNNKLYSVYYKRKDSFHRDGDKPAIIWYYNNGNIEKEFYYKRGNFHRDGDKPAKIWYYTDGSIQQEIYYKKNKLHRDDDKPAIIWYYNNGNITYESYYKEGKCHRDGEKPAEICYSLNRREYEFYCINGKLYKINEIKKGIISWEYIYKYKKYDIEFLVKYSKQMGEYMSREEKLKVIEYKMRINV